ncbi:hypothetical protein SAMN05216189_102923 [Pseudomonas delhiensis]|uniref:Nucleotide modification associated domain-containing protein n=1 Tax=Pseudomonas delhiensis TaxID=366289 RepID=A0A239IWI5_9PSED|nr:hypothetical protein [Pseudomonas delhiensis]SDK11691.1 hypothetical protein SAMN05216189_102923 [Pseudomonas delhiensis]SNS97742.1 hypothetical protein SAMN06295949_11124 [Pseudomonas delhiensis]
MKLLKYVMTHDTGLAPNPFFGVCSLALCTPNHKKARLLPGDWVVGHSSKSTGHRLVYAMQLTEVLSMDEYFKAFPEKRPDPCGSPEQRSGDNLYFREGGGWLRVPSAEHNDVESFLNDQGRPVYLAEGEDHFWYFGAANPMPEIQGFADRFPWLIKNRQGFSYIHDAERIQAFAQWLSSLKRSGRLGSPRDQQPIATDRYLIAVDPEPVWRIDGAIASHGPSTVARCTRSARRKRPVKRGC